MTVAVECIEKSELPACYLDTYMLTRTGFLFLFSTGSWSCPYDTL